MGFSVLSVLQLPPLMPEPFCHLKKEALYPLAVVPLTATNVLSVSVDLTCIAHFIQIESLNICPFVLHFVFVLCFDIA